MVEAIVAIMPLDRIVARIAIAAQHLDRPFVRLEAMLRRPTLGHRRQQPQERLEPVPLRRILRDALPVDQQRAIGGERQPALDRRLLRQQHPPHIGMGDDRNLRRRRIALIRQPPLGPFARIVPRMQIARQRRHDRGMADPDPRLVHHVEHVAQAVVFRTDQIADRLVRLAEVQQAVHRAPLPHLVVEPGKRDIVPRPRRAALVQPVARHEKERDAPGPRRRPLDLGQNHVDDVLGHFVIPARDPHLAARDRIAAVLPPPGTGPDIGQRRSRLRFRQAHRAEPAPLQHRAEELRLLLFAAESVQHIGRRRGQERIVGQRKIGRREHPVEVGRHDPGQLQPAHLLVETGGEKPRFGKGGKGLPGLLGDLDPTVHEGRFPGIEQRGDRQEMLCRQRLGHIEHGADRRPVMGTVAGRGQQRLQPEHLVENEIEISAVDDVRHGVPLVIRSHPEIFLYVCTVLNVTKASPESTLSWQRRAPRRAILIAHLPFHRRILRSMSLRRGRLSGISPRIGIDSRQEDVLPNIQEEGETPCASVCRVKSRTMNIGSG